MQAIDGVVVVIDAVRGVESQTETVWRYLEELEVPRLVFINKLDRDVADLDVALRLLRGCFDTLLLPMIHPQPGERICIDLLESDSPSLAEERGRIVEACADEDATIMTDYVEGNHVTADRLLPLLRRGTLEGRMVPVFAGSALHGWGVAELLDGICKYLPAPQDRQRRAAGGQKLHSDPDRELAALLFKVAVEDDRHRSLLPGLGAQRQEHRGGKSDEALEQRHEGHDSGELQVCFHGVLENCAREERGGEHRGTEGDSVEEHGAVDAFAGLSEEQRPHQEDRPHHEKAGVEGLQAGERLE